MEAVDSFFDLLYSHHPQGQGEDQLSWRLPKSGKFEVSSFYEHLREPTGVHFPWKSIWRVKVPHKIAFFVHKIAFFVRTIALGKILTVENLRKCSLMIIDCCCNCKSNGDSVDHLLLHCPLPMDLWSFVFNLFGISWVMPKTVTQKLDCWQGKFHRHRHLKIWKVNPYVSCGPFGRRGTEGPLKVLSNLFMYSSK